MLTIVAGRAGTGKTEYCIQLAAELANEGRRVVLVVPEQSSYACERSIASRVPQQAMTLITVRSFKRLCGDIFDIMGDGARKRVSEAHKHALVRMALADMGENARFYRRCRNDHAFFELVASAADELANAGVSVESLSAAAGNAKTEVSRAKLAELAEIIARYRERLSAVGRDEATELEAAAGLCARGGCFAGQTVIFDGFSGFTEPEFSLITALLGSCDVVCTLCYEPNGDNETFAIERATARRLENTLRELGLRRPELVYLEKTHRFKAAGLAAVESYLAGRKDSGERAGVFSFEAKNAADESETVAAEISWLVRERGYRFAEIAVLTRDMKSYRAPLEGAFERCGIPYFADEADNLLHAAAARFVICALDIARSLTTEKLLSLLKTGLFDVSDGEIAALENYAFVHEVEGSGWFERFESNPNGFGTPDKAGQALLEECEGAREKIMLSLEPFAKRAGALKGAALVDEVYSLMQSCGALERLENGGEKAVREGSAAVMCIEQLHDISAGQPLSASELMDLMRTLARSAPLADIPPALEQVTLAQADRARLDSPRAVFVVGLSDGAFPLESFESPLLTQNERELLSEYGVRLGRDIDRAAEMERVYLYRALTAASERLYMSHPHSSPSGGIDASAVLRDIEKLARCAGPESDKTEVPRAVNTRTALREYLRRRELQNDADAELLASALPAELIRHAEAACAAPHFEIKNTELMHRVLGSTMSLSPTRIETFEKCRFEYFLNYVMKIRPLNKAEINPIEAGSFIHAVAEYAIGHTEDISKCTDDELRALAETAAGEYIKSYIKGATGKNARLAYIIRRLIEQSYRLLRAIRGWFAQTDFHAVDCELVIGRNGDVKPIELVTPTGQKIYVEGKIDRVDICEINGEKYVSVVDYKTGEKQFSLTDVYNGLNLQMLIYLFTLCQNGKERYGDISPAAVLYMPSDPKKQSENGNAQYAYHMDGLVLDDPEVVRALEKNGKGIFLPVSIDPDGKTDSGRYDKLASLARLGNIRRHIEKTVVEMAEALYDGDIEASPLAVSGGMSPCDYCGYAAICRRERGGETRPLITPQKGVFEPEQAPLDGADKEAAPQNDEAAHKEETPQKEETAAESGENDKKEKEAAQ